jgi:hypothetical protein
MTEENECAQAMLSRLNGLLPPFMELHVSMLSAPVVLLP